ncbi:hypothetical protein L207DRAFT_586610 [Hyaloscypha variabilis F]|uniref:SH3b domain-containing protein n=1 Tax=Hyaloscypha variabilis (strain UAMH 11265 / GT02V1 / F) TaxID=1149755 RepID=A0A2J6REI9_HYAVF|nr:hypothetical protein L207DRAFT_586610 [Hyaloscypha variabilis F]
MAIREAAGASLAAANILCQIVSRDGPVNCRSGPGTSFGIVTKVYNGDYYDFTCYSDGTDVDNNYTWDLNADEGCYVSGYYTDDNCSAANLGPC